MTTQDLSKDIVLAKKAAFKSGEFLLNNKDKINKRLDYRKIKKMFLTEWESREALDGADRSASSS